MSLAYLALSANILLLVSGQLLWKAGLTRSAMGHDSQLLQVAFSPFIWAGLVLYGLATVLWLFALSRLPLSVAYPIQALAYILGMVAAQRLFGETVPLSAWLGGMLILFGVALVAYRPGT
ncbi:MAG: EamA family transporter [Symbiobacteriia bacterium]